MKKLDYEEDIEKMIILSQKDTSVEDLMFRLLTEKFGNLICITLFAILLLLVTNPITILLFIISLMRIPANFIYIFISQFVTSLRKKRATSKLEQLSEIIEEEKITSDNLTNAVEVTEIFTQLTKENDKGIGSYVDVENNYFYFLDEKEKLHIIQQQLCEEKMKRETYFYDSEDILNTYIPDQVYQKLKLTHKNLPQVTSSTNS